MLEQNINSQLKKLLKFILLILVIIITTKIVLNNNKNNKFILTEFYYPAISNLKNNSTVREMYNLKPEINHIKSVLNWYSNIEEFNIIDHLNRSNYYYFLFKKDEISLIQNLSSRKIKDLLFNPKMSKYSNFFHTLNKFIINENNQLTFHTKKMYNEKTTWKSKEFFNNNNVQKIAPLIWTPLFIKEVKKFDLKEIKKKFELVDCKILKNINFIKISCNFFSPLNILQNTEINYYY